MLGTQAIPWIYFLIMGKYSFDGATHYTVVATKVCAVMFIVWLIKWSVDNDKLEKPKNKRLLDLYARYGPKAIKKRFIDFPVQTMVSTVKCVLIAASVMMTFYLTLNTIQVIPYYEKAGEIYKNAEQAAQTDDKVYKYDSKKLLMSSGKSSIFAVNQSMLSIGHISAGWMEEYYGITITVDGATDKAWSTKNLKKEKGEKALAQY